MICRTRAEAKRLYQAALKFVSNMRPVRIDDGARPPVRANVTYYGDRGVRPHRSQSRKRRSG